MANVNFPSLTLPQPQTFQQQNFTQLGQLGRPLGELFARFNPQANTAVNWKELARGLTGLNPQGQVPGGFGNYMSALFGGSGGWRPVP